MKRYVRITVWHGMRRYLRKKMIPLDLTDESFRGLKGNYTVAQVEQVTTFAHIAIA